LEAGEKEKRGHCKKGQRPTLGKPWIVDEKKREKRGSSAREKIGRKPVKGEGGGLVRFREKEKRKPCTQFLMFPEPAEHSANGPNLYGERKRCLRSGGKRSC